jgi:hypothetical protein
MNAEWENEPVFCFTSDIDWASEATIEYSHKLLSASDLGLTYFNTHPSAYLDTLRAENKIKMLIHPNFLPDSSHGNSFAEVMDYCKKLVPEADGFRSHRYFEVNDIMDEFFARKFKFVSNICTRCEENLHPFFHRSGLVSIPIFLEDGGYLLTDKELNFSKLLTRLSSPGLKVINFHPAHMAFNTPNFAYTRSVKDRLSRDAWNNMSLSDIKSVEYQGLGIRNVIQSIIEFAMKRRHKILSMHQIYDAFVASRG